MNSPIFSYAFLPAALVLLLFSTTSKAAGADSGTTPSPVVFNFSPGAQIAGPDQSVVGLRGTAFYGENKNMFGADLAFGSSYTKETFAGTSFAGISNATGKAAYIFLLQGAGIANVNYGSAYVAGLQLAGVFNHNGGDGKVFGAQIAAIANDARKTDIYGLQLGLYNRARKVVGFQVGLVNFAADLRGIQLGLLNFNDRAVPFKVFPVFNIGF